MTIGSEGSPRGTATLACPERSRRGCALPTGHGTPSTELRNSPYNVPSTSGEHTMRYRKFGRTGWNVSEIGYGMCGLLGWNGLHHGESSDAPQRGLVSR